MTAQRIMVPTVCLLQRYAQSAAETAQRICVDVAPFPMTSLQPMKNRKNSKRKRASRRKRAPQARIVTDPLTGLQVLKARKGAPKLTSEEVSRMLADFP
jgi:hypothetical protein